MDTSAWVAIAVAVAVIVVILLVVLALRGRGRREEQRRLEEQDRHRRARTQMAEADLKQADADSRAARARREAALAEQQAVEAEQVRAEAERLDNGSSKARTPGAPSDQREDVDRSVASRGDGSGDGRRSSVEADDGQDRQDHGAQVDADRARRPVASSGATTVTDPGAASLADRETPSAREKLAERVGIDRDRTSGEVDLRGDSDAVDLTDRSRTTSERPER